MGQRWGSHHGLLTETGATETWYQVSLVRQTDALEKERRTVVLRARQTGSSEAVAMAAPGKSTIPAMFRKATNTPWTGLGREG